MPFDTDSLLAATRAGPSLDPNIISSVATVSPDLSTARSLAGAIQAYGGAAKARSQLEAQDDAIQARLWLHSSEADRRLWMGVGYRPPTDPEAHKHARRGWFGFVETGLQDVGRGLGGVAKVAEHGASEALHYAGAPLRQVEHLYRAAAMMTDENVLAGRGQFSLHGLMSPGTWARTLHESEHGEQTFSPVEERQAISRWGAETVGLAKDLASGMKPEELVSAAPADQRVGLVRRLQGDSDLHEAVAFMRASHLSVGRRLVSPSLAVSHPLLHRAVSGGIDALADWYSDPLVIGMKVHKASGVLGAAVPNFATHADDFAGMVANAEDISRKVQDPNIRRGIDWMSEQLSHGEDGVALVAATKPEWHSVADKLFAEGKQSPEEIIDWMKGTAGMESLLRGEFAGIASKHPTLPTLSRMGERGLNTKIAVKGAIDWAAEPAEWAEKTVTHPITGIEEVVPVATGAAHGRAIQTAGEVAKALVTINPRGKTIQAFGPEATHEIMNFARVLGLPESRVREVGALWTAERDINARRKIFQSLELEIGATLGVAPDSAFMQRVLRRTTGAGQTYAYGNVDEMRTGAQAFLANDMSLQWHLPRRREWMAAARKSRELNAAIDGMDHFIEGAWKPSMLLRPAFALRAGGEEFVEAVMRYGPQSMLRARASHSVATAEIRGTEADRLLPYNPFRYTFDLVTKHLPEPVRASIRTGDEFLATYVWDNYRHAFRSVEKRYAGETAMEYARDFVSNKMVQDAVSRRLLAAHQPGGGFLDPRGTKIQVFTEDGRIRPVWVSPTGSYREYQRGTSNYEERWQFTMNHFATDEIGAEALKLHDLPHDEAVQQLADYIGSDRMARIRKLAFRDIELPGGEVVGQDATHREALESWADVTLRGMHQIFFNEAGEPITRFIERAKAMDVPSLEEIRDLPAHMKPFAVMGPEMLPVPRNWLAVAMDKGFYELVGKPMDWLVREPLALHNYANGRELAKGLAVYGLNEDDQREWAVYKAIDDTIPFIHDPEFRSHASDVLRNLAPFYFAQEQFYKRFARNLKFAPWAFRQAQLVMGGLRSVGVLQKDEQGNDYFMYPAVSAAQQVLTHGFKLFTGTDASLPIPVGFSGQVRFATPGLERLGLPSFGPFVGLPMHVLAERFPELAPVEAGALGERGTGRAIWEMLLPPTVSRFAHTLIDREETSKQYASLMMQSMAYLEATGNGPKDDASAHDVEVWKDRVRSWVRTGFLLRTIYGFGAPAAPQFEMDPKNLHGEFRGLLASLPFRDALQEYIRLHPDATAHTVFPTNSKSGGYLPATQRAASFMERNRGFLEAHPTAGGWFLPQAPEKKEDFSLVAFREQMAYGLRTRKLPDDFYDDIKFAEAARDYFDTRDQKDADLVAAGNNSGARREINQSYSTWKERYLAAHPIFRDRLADPSAANRRQRVMDELHDAFQDNRMPSDPHIRRLRDFVDTYDQFRGEVDSLKGRRDRMASSQRSTLTGLFKGWAEQYVKDNVDLQGFYDSVVRPEVEV